MDILYKPPFKKFVKKQPRPFQLIVEDEVEKVVSNPCLGEAKKGDLSGLRVHKFKFQKQEYLVAYSAESRSIIFYMIETHENFYRNLKQYLREVE
ncbi:MAG: hypothetical protein OHK0032_05220 [Thermodesulfovibrionales bacterium]